MFVFFFFFSSRRRHTRYIGDWSSDVCSSDLVVRHDGGVYVTHPGGGRTTRSLPAISSAMTCALRSEERRVGKECRSRESPYHKKKSEKPNWTRQATVRDNK